MESTVNMGVIFLEYEEFDYFWNFDALIILGILEVFLYNPDGLWNKTMRWWVWQFSAKTCRNQPASDPIFTLYRRRCRKKIRRRRPFFQAALEPQTAHLPRFFEAVYGQYIGDRQNFRPWVIIYRRPWIYKNTSLKSGEITSQEIGPIDTIKELKFD
ncbi:hypothetical protein [Comamonas composti]|uniref:hypothetical protein n=1 Tax=Comamonas composti TaxID=408558 RepID=UPI0012EC4771|nr:hypothetical protein [Comamonas composti]